MRGGEMSLFVCFRLSPPRLSPAFSKKGDDIMDWNKLLYWISLQIEYSESRLDELSQMRAIVEGLIENDENAEKKQNICAVSDDIAALAAPRL